MCCVILHHRVARSIAEFKFLSFMSAIRMVYCRLRGTLWYSVVNNAKIQNQKRVVKYFGNYFSIISILKGIFLKHIGEWIDSRRRMELEGVGYSGIQVFSFCKRFEKRDRNSIIIYLLLYYFYKHELHYQHQFKLTEYLNTWIPLWVIACYKIQMFHQIFYNFLYSVILFLLLCIR